MNFTKWEHGKLKALVAAEAATYAGYAALGRLKPAELEYYQTKLKPLYDKLDADGPDHDPDELIERLRKRMLGVEFMNPNRPTMMNDVGRLNRRLGYEKASDAIHARHGNEYLALLLAWEHVYGIKTSDKPGEANAPEHSGASDLPRDVEGRPVEDTEEQRRREQEAAGEAGDGWVSRDQPAHSPHGGGDGDGDGVPGAPYPSGSSVDF